MTLWSVLMIGFLLGLRHATDADHVVAVAALATQERSLSRVVRQGLVWGLGHASVLFGLGAVALLTGKAIAHDLAQALEVCVGVMLVGLGLDLWRRIAKESARSRDPRSNHRIRSHTLPGRAFWVGVMHGLAGTASIVLLSVASMSSVVGGLVYIAVFGAGSVLGMAILSLVIGVPLRFSVRGVGPLHHRLSTAIGAVSFFLGLFVIYRVGVLEGFFATAAVGAV
jgi:cytochrome c biogenesis protein CcdA